MYYFETFIAQSKSQSSFKIQNAALFLHITRQVSSFPLPKKTGGCEGYAVTAEIWSQVVEQEH